MSEAIEAARDLIRDVSSRRVARTYAEALMAAADKRGEVDALLDELRELARLVSIPGSLLRTFFTSGTVSRRDRAAALQSAFEGRSSELVSNFLQVLNAHDRLELFTTAVDCYRELHEQRRGLKRVQVRAAAPLPDDQRERLLHELRQALGGEPVLDVTVDPELLGGMVVQSGDWLYDASVVGRLRALQDQLSESIKHEIQSGRDRFRSDD